jgi:hypothetical protein
LAANFPRFLDLKDLREVGAHTCRRGDFTRVGETFKHLWVLGVSQMYLVKRLPATKKRSKYRIVRPDLLGMDLLTKLYFLNFSRAGTSSPAPLVWPNANQQLVVYRMETPSLEINKDKGLPIPEIY